MNYNFIANSTTELNRYISTLSYTIRKAYLSPHFYVLDYLPKGIENSVIYIPRLMESFTKESKQFLEDNFISSEELLDKNFSKSKFARSLTEMPKPVKEYRVRELQEKWMDNSEKFEKILNQIFPKSVMDMIKNVDIVVTKIGSLGSYSRVMPGKRIQIVQRVDSDISVVAETIVSSIISELNKYKHMTYYSTFMKTTAWIINENISDFFMMNTILKELYPNFKATLEVAKTDSSSKFFEESKNYLEFYGICNDPEIKLEDGKIKKYITNEEIIGLNAQEFSVTKLLIENMNEIVNYEMIAKVLWGEDYINRYSLNAMTKLIFSIRQKLLLNDINFTKIETIRKRGYAIRG